MKLFKIAITILVLSAGSTLGIAASKYVDSTTLVVPAYTNYVPSVSIYK